MPAGRPVVAALALDFVPLQANASHFLEGAAGGDLRAPALALGGASGRRIDPLSDGLPCARFRVFAIEAMDADLRPRSWLRPRPRGAEPKIHHLVPDGPIQGISPVPWA